MFTGIIETTATITELETKGDGKKMSLLIKEMKKPLSIGDSIAFNGVCSTVTHIDGSLITVDYLKESLEKTTASDWDTTTILNVEWPLTPTTPMGGHYVTGHVDSTGTFDVIAKGDPFGMITISYRPEFDPYIVTKGSICIDGMSLTVVDDLPNQFTCHLIEHTFQNTNLLSKKIGDKCNLEFDILGKYMHKFYTKRHV